MQMSSIFILKNTMKSCENSLFSSLEILHKKALSFNISFYI